MRFVNRLVAVAFLSVTGTPSASLAQRPNTAQSPQDQAKAHDKIADERPVGLDATEYPPQDSPAPRLLKGTLVRPKAYVQHPRLDKAWADYDAAVATTLESIETAIRKQFDGATAKGDLDAAEEWQAALEKLKSTGEAPTAVEMKATMGVIVSEYKKSRKHLIAAYDSVIKELTMEKKILEAKTVRAELQALSAENRSGQPNAVNALKLGRTGEDFAGPTVGFARPDGQPDMHLRIIGVSKAVATVHVDTDVGPSSWTSAGGGSHRLVFFAQKGGIDVFFYAPGEAFEKAHFVISLGYADGSAQRVETESTSE